MTTPNVGHWVSRLRFLLRGELRSFDPDCGRRLRHLSPLPKPQILQMLEEVGFECVRETTVGNPFSPVGRLLTYPLRLAFRATLGRDAVGESAIFLARKVTGVR